MSNTQLWDQALIEKYNYSGPRYTSYPTALEFNENFNEQDFLSAATAYPTKPLSLYVHIPFCHKLCYFCGCNKLITRQTQKVTKYLDILDIEITERAKLFKNRTVTQMHWGGGTPTFLTNDEISRLIASLKKHFHFANNAELSIEIDPREITPETIDHLAHVGFNRLSMGIQDFNDEIQNLINRKQDENLIRALIEQARKNHFHSISLDLIYGLPKQTVASFTETLNKVIAISPDRLSVFNYAHLPSRFAAQRKIKDDDLPNANQKLQILQTSIEKLTNAGYQFIGMDHFAKPTDELAIAQQENKLHRNFQGYTTQGDADLLGLGVSSISILGDSYAQNQKDLKQYQNQVENLGNALWKGFNLSLDDKIRRDVIKQLICHFYLDKKTIEQQYHIQFDDYFAEDLKLLKPLQKDGLVTINEQVITIQPKGHLLIRNICMCFDIYMRKMARQQQFSRVI
ncbi:MULTISPECIES: oxygen-independent coproporphyrinogen III oxidase [unclassified Gilliamella]|uniref:oxygen-independent coproporphyrinogen III oxidase n=1 Tax=unclassified Gilliamella TaxID=2685620 RepID=UPI001309ED9C|nr:MULTISPECIES: oxygen-independent coproporphyrinogen III oxidase [unclassified Gilliamella]MWP49361.1 oxygen-independent coproporphyrinogen III oxidase [Gilliamella sp. Lep-s35]MWP68985.1 oxygen-independent coproporphyrinogen III oxidase [Gilliamella sp. Lep-s5]MWP77352.1 oxygen-independent coproporphyrinogen III oxidase [Gilliamella sp. Lep-s21]